MFERFIEAVERNRKHCTVYSDAEDTDLDEKLATRNITVEHRKLPANGPQPFVTFHERDGQVGALPLETVRRFLAPPVVSLGQSDRDKAEYRTVLDMLEETVFASLNRRQLLATSREIEDRAFRVGSGTLRVRFQSQSSLQSQQAIYHRLGTETDLSIHLYANPGCPSPEIENTTFHPDPAGKLAPFWVLAFDGGGTPKQACTLVAARRNGSHTGFWSYDSELVAEVMRTFQIAVE